MAGSTRSDINSRWREQQRSGQAASRSFPRPTAPPPGRGIETSAPPLFETICDMHARPSPRGYRGVPCARSRSRTNVWCLRFVGERRREEVGRNAYQCVAAAARNRENKLRPPSPLCPVDTRRAGDNASFWETVPRSVELSDLSTASRFLSSPASKAPYSANGTTVWRWRPRPSISSSITSPALRYCGGFITEPTPGGVPVVTMSPGSSTQNCVT